MSSNRQLQVSQLDFDEIKANLITFLKSQDTLKDYNFTGSALNILMDVLAYNTHYNALYHNLAINEMFLDSLSKYSSAVSLAKTIGYTAKSVISARAKINLTVTLPDTETPSVLTLPAGTIFTCQVNKSSFLFTTLVDYTVQRISGTYTFNGVEIVEGTSLTKAYTVASGSTFVIPNQSADVSSLIVKVSEGGSWYIYNPSLDLMEAKADSRVFFVKQREDLFYEVYFGNDNIGRAVQNGWIVKLQYLKSSGADANGANQFAYGGGFRGDVQYDITVVTAAQNGTPAESLDSIKYNAPRAFITQNRGVTSGDYSSLILTNYPEIESVNVWGGQDHIPKTYGKVFIAAKPYGADYLSDATKNKITTTLLAQKNVVSVLPVMVDPLYLKVEFTANVYYNPNTARYSAGAMQASIINALTAYSATLNKFDSTFRFSKASTIIDNIDACVISNISTIRVHRPVAPQFVSNAKYSMTFANPIAVDSNVGGTFVSSLFLEINEIDPVYLMDNGNGVINLFRQVGAISTLIRPVGTINYASGTVDIPLLNVRGMYDPEFEFIITPLSNDVIPTREYIVTMPSSMMTVNMIVDGISTGNTEGNTNHIFSASR